jgi:hypothetical protein
MTIAARIFAVAALVLCAAPAFAQNGSDPGQTTPKAEPPPVPDKGITSQFNCVDENGKHMGTRNHLFYRVEMTNKCEQRLKCQIFAYAVASKGPSQGRATLVLASKSRGAPTQIYDFKIKGTGGLITVSRECRVF